MEDSSIWQYQPSNINNKANVRRPMSMSCIDFGAPTTYGQTRNALSYPKGSDFSRSDSLRSNSNGGNGGRKTKHKKEEEKKKRDDIYREKLEKQQIHQHLFAGNPTALTSYRHKKPPPSREQQRKEERAARLRKKLDKQQKTSTTQTNLPTLGVKRAINYGGNNSSFLGSNLVNTSLMSPSTQYSTANGGGSNSSSGSITNSAVLNKHKSNANKSKPKNRKSNSNYKKQKKSNNRKNKSNNSNKSRQNNRKSNRTQQSNHSNIDLKTMAKVSEVDRKPDLFPDLPSSPPNDGYTRLPPHDQITLSDDSRSASPTSAIAAHPNARYLVNGGRTTDHSSQLSTTYYPGQGRTITIANGRPLTSSYEAYERIPFNHQIAALYNSHPFRREADEVDDEDIDPESLIETGLNSIPKRTFTQLSHRIDESLQSPKLDFTSPQSSDDNDNPEEDSGEHSSADEVEIEEPRRYTPEEILRARATLNGLEEKEGCVAEIAPLLKHIHDTDSPDALCVPSYHDTEHSLYQPMDQALPPPPDDEDDELPDLQHEHEIEEEEKIEIIVQEPPRKTKRRAPTDSISYTSRKRAKKSAEEESISNALCPPLEEDSNNSDMELEQPMTSLETIDNESISKATTDEVLSSPNESKDKPLKESKIDPFENAQEMIEIKPKSSTKQKKENKSKNTSQSQQSGANKKRRKKNRNKNKRKLIEKNDDSIAVSPKNETIEHQSTIPKPQINSDDLTTIQSPKTLTVTPVTATAVPITEEPTTATTTTNTRKKAKKKRKKRKKTNAIAVPIENDIPIDTVTNDKPDTKDIESIASSVEENTDWKVVRSAKKRKPRNAHASPIVPIAFEFPPVTDASALLSPNDSTDDKTPLQNDSISPRIPPLITHKFEKPVSRPLSVTATPVIVKHISAVKSDDTTDNSTPVSTHNQMPSLSALNSKEKPKWIPKDRQSRKPFNNHNSNHNSNGYLPTTSPRVSTPTEIPKKTQQSSHWTKKKPKFSKHDRSKNNNTPLSRIPLKTRTMKAWNGSNNAVTSPSISTQTDRLPIGSTSAILNSHNTHSNKRQKISPIGKSRLISDNNNHNIQPHTAPPKISRPTRPPMSSFGKSKPLDLGGSSSGSLSTPFSTSLSSDTFTPQNRPMASTHHREPPSEVTRIAHIDPPHNNNSHAASTSIPPSQQQQQTPLQSLLQPPSTTTTTTMPTLANPLSSNLSLGGLSAISSALPPLPIQITFPTGPLLSTSTPQSNTQTNALPFGMLPHTSLPNDAQSTPVTTLPTTMTPITSLPTSMTPVTSADGAPPGLVGASALFPFMNFLPPLTAPLFVTPPNAAPPPAHTQTTENMDDASSTSDTAPTNTSSVHSSSQTNPTSLIPPPTLPPGLPLLPPGLSSLAATLPPGLAQTIPLTQGLGLPQALTQAMPQAMPQTMSQALTQALPQALSQGLPQGLAQALPAGLPPLVNPNMPPEKMIENINAIQNILDTWTANGTLPPLGPPHPNAGQNPFLPHPSLLNPSLYTPNPNLFQTLLPQQQPTLLQPPPPQQQPMQQNSNIETQTQTQQPPPFNNGN